MIVLDKLKKTYISKSGQQCNALNGISLSLPEKGMVFIVGQSGSGKSTLLNLLGGLDSITEGEITVDGVKFSDFKEKDYDNYRKSYVGFVFQEYCLIENMTIYQNIRLGLDLQGEEDTFQVDSILRTVGLQGYGHRYPRELSGGQKQRVGIARAIVKNPRLILADEPTGNLDSKISTQVLDFLKEISKNKLVLIISHSNNDAMKYADRIIELDSGLVVSDTSRVNDVENKLIENNTINLPLNKKLSMKELEEVNVAVNAGGHEIVQVSENFVATKIDNDRKSRKYYVPKDALKFKGKMYLSSKFMKGNALNILVTSICVSLLIILLSVCQIFMTFSGNELIRESITEDTKSISISKGYRSDSELSILWAEKLVGIEETEIKEFYDTGYEGNIFKLYSINMPVDYSASSAMISGSQVEYKTLNNFYLNYGRGVLECDKEFLTKIYGKNGELRVLAGDINDDSKKAGLIITDYFADSLMYYNKQKLTSYEDIVSATSIGNNGMLYQVKAIIETDYKEKYIDLIDAYTEAFSKSSSVDRKSALAEIKELELYAEFREDLISYLSIGYYFGSDYESVVLEELGNSLIFAFQNPDMIIGNKETTLTSLRIRKATGSVEPGKMIMGTTVYNTIFKTSYGSNDLSNIEPFDLTINEYTYTNNIGEPEISKNFEVIQFNSSPYLYLNEEDFETFARHTMINYSLYFDNPQSFATIVDSNVAEDYFSSSDYYRTIFSVLDVVNVFSDFFLLLFLGLALICAMLICSCIKRTVRRKFYDMGVIRALGGRNSGITFAFIIQIIILALNIMTMSIVGMSILDNQMNTLLVENLADLMIIKPISGLVMISFDPLSVFFIVLSVLSLCLISLFAMIGLCRKVKPIYIIKKNNL